MRSKDKMAIRVPLESSTRAPHPEIIVVPNPRLQSTSAFIRGLAVELLKRENRNSDQNLQSYRLTIELGWPEGPVIQRRQYGPVKSHVRAFADAELLQLPVRAHRGVNDHQSTNITANQLSIHLRNFFFYRIRRREPGLQRSAVSASGPLQQSLLMV